MGKLSNEGLPASRRFVFSEPLICFLQFLIRRRRIHQRVDENFVLVLSKLPDGTFRNGLPGGLLQGADYKISYGPALNGRGALDQLFLIRRDPRFEALIPVTYC